MAHKPIGIVTAGFLGGVIGLATFGLLHRTLTRRQPRLGVRFVVGKDTFRFEADAGLYRFEAAAQVYQFEVPYERHRFKVEAATMANNVAGQDPNAHLFYEVDWSKWLSNRGLTISDIISVAFTVPAPAEKTDEELVGAVGRVYVRNVPVGKRITVSCRMTATNPSPGDPLVDDFTFVIVGRSS